MFIDIKNVRGCLISLNTDHILRIYDNTVVMAGGKQGSTSTVKQILIHKKTADWLRAMLSSIPYEAHRYKVE